MSENAAESKAISVAATEEDREAPSPPSSCPRAKVVSPAADDNDEHEDEEKGEGEGNVGVDDKGKEDKEDKGEDKSEAVGVMKEEHEIGAALKMLEQLKRSASDSSNENTSSARRGALLLLGTANAVRTANADITANAEGTTNAEGASNTEETANAEGTATAEGTSNAGGTANTEGTAKAGESDRPSNPLAALVIPGVSTSGGSTESRPNSALASIASFATAVISTPTAATMSRSSPFGDGAATTTPGGDTTTTAAPSKASSSTFYGGGGSGDALDPVTSSSSTSEKKDSDKNQSDSKGPADALSKLMSLAQQDSSAVSPKGNTLGTVASEDNAASKFLSALGSPKGTTDLLRRTSSSLTFGLSPAVVGVTAATDPVASALLKVTAPANAGTTGSGPASPLAVLTAGASSSSSSSAIPSLATLSSNSSQNALADIVARSSSNNVSICDGSIESKENPLSKERGIANLAELVKTTAQPLGSPRLVSSHLGPPGLADNATKPSLANAPSTDDLISILQLSRSTTQGSPTTQGSLESKKEQGAANKEKKEDTNDGKRTKDQDKDAAEEEKKKGDDKAKPEDNTVSKSDDNVEMADAKPSKGVDDDADTNQEDENMDNPNDERGNDNCEVKVENTIGEVKPENKDDDAKMDEDDGDKKKREDEEHRISSDGDSKTDSEEAVSENESNEVTSDDTRTEEGKPDDEKKNEKSKNHTLEENAPTENEKQPETKEGTMKDNNMDTGDDRTQTSADKNSAADEDKMNTELAKEETADESAESVAKAAAATDMATAKENAEAEVQATEKENKCSAQEVKRSRAEAKRMKREREKKAAEDQRLVAELELKRVASRAVREHRAEEELLDLAEETRACDIATLKRRVLSANWPNNEHNSAAKAWFTPKRTWRLMAVEQAERSEQADRTAYKLKNSNDDEPDVLEEEALGQKREQDIAAASFISVEDRATYYALTGRLRKMRRLLKSHGRTSLPASLDFVLRFQESDDQQQVIGEQAKQQKEGKQPDKPWFLKKCKHGLFTAVAVQDYLVSDVIPRVGERKLAEVEAAARSEVQQQKQVAFLQQQAALAQAQVQQALQAQQQAVAVQQQQAAIQQQQVDDRGIEAGINELNTLEECEKVQQQLVEQVQIVQIYIRQLENFVQVVPPEQEAALLQQLDQRRRIYQQLLYAHQQLQQKVRTLQQLQG